MNLEIGGASFQAFYSQFVKPTPGRALVVGSRVYPGRIDRRTLFAHADGLDMLDGPGVDMVRDLEEPLDAEPYDHVDCVSVLEHCRRPWLVAENLQRLMRPGSSIFVSVPFIWRIHAYPHDYWRLTPDCLRVIFPRVEWLALKLASETLRSGPKIPGERIRGYVHMPRTETVGFGVLQ